MMPGTPFSTAPRSVLWACCALLLVAAGARAQQASPFLEATGLNCTFTVMSTGNWTKPGEPSIAVKPFEMPMEFNNLNALDGSANVKGNTGNLLITVMLLGGNLHLVVSNTGGLLHVTSVSTSESRPGFYKAVHSRHELAETAVIIPGYTSRPEQYLGECAIVKN